MLPRAAAAAAVRHDDMNPFNPFKKVKSAKMNRFLSSQMFVVFSIPENILKNLTEISLAA